MEIQSILSQIEVGSFALPEFQRGYVWNRDQVKKLITALYKGYPIGSLLVWVTKTEGVSTKGDGQVSPGMVKLILDGQQRITSLYGIIKGKEPEFFEGDKKAFTGLYFNLLDETFEFYAPLKMQDNPVWINVSELMSEGAGQYILKIITLPEIKENINLYANRLNTIDNIKKINLHIQEVAGDKMTIDVVVDIFNNVNSGGTKLSKGDLALAKICSMWTEARREMRKRLDKWSNAGFNFTLDWFLRCITAYLTGEAYYSSMKNITPEIFKDALNKTERLIDTILNHISSRLGLDHNRVLGSKASIPLIARYLKNNNGKLDNDEWNKVLYWYINTLLWGRYSSSTESVLSSDLNIIEKQDNGINGVIDLLRQNRGDLSVKPDDFISWSTGSRFYPLLYLLTRTMHARDFISNLDLTDKLLGRMNSLEVHHIFPKSLLYDYGYDKTEVNTVANFTFLTKETNIQISNNNPEVYFREIQEKNPGALESHWIPMDEELWKIENFREFLEQRRILLANSANKLLNSLLSDKSDDVKIDDYANRVINNGEKSITSDEEMKLVVSINEWMYSNGLSEGEIMYELTDEEGNAIAMLDLAWPDGIQKELSKPVALLINESKELENLVNEYGYTYYTNEADFKRYVYERFISVNTAEAS